VGKEPTRRLWGHRCGRAAWRIIIIVVVIIVIIIIVGAELFQVAVEALSNVRRHTAATHVAIRLVTDQDHVTLRVENQEPSNGRPTPFTPRSIRERASALGGRVTVDRHRDGRTIVEIRIPL